MRHLHRQLGKSKYGAELTWGVTETRKAITTMKYANLHLHSFYSDSQFTPEQLVLLGKSLGYRVIALTDHETDGGYKRLSACAKREGGIDTLLGCEFYGSYAGEKLHLTALDYDIDNPALRRFIKERIDAYTLRTQRCFELGIRLGLIDGVSWADVLDCADEGTWVCGSTITQAFYRKKVPIHPDMTKKAFKSPEAKSYYPTAPTAEEVIKLVRGAGGVIALAHPQNQTQYIPALVDMGLNGVETCHPDLDEKNVELAIAAAERFGLYHCGGTDHTGPMSCCGGKYAIPAYHGITEEQYFTLINRKLG